MESVRGHGIFLLGEIEITSSILHAIYCNTGNIFSLTVESIFSLTKRQMLRTLLLSAVSVLGIMTIQDCSTSSIFKIQELSVTPSDPIPGTNVTVRVIFDAPDIVTGGTVETRCLINGIPLIQDVSDLCNATTCPVSVGVHDQSGITPTSTSKGTVACSIKWYDLAKKELLCMKVVQQSTSLRGCSAKDEL